MPVTAYDVIVVGVGGSGSAAVYHLARRGSKVLGLEQADIPNDIGSSHGVTRIIRLAYHEDPAYVPLLRRAYQSWRELEVQAGERLLTITGCLNIAPPGSVVFDGCLKSARVHNLPHEVMDAGEVMARYPAFRLPQNFMAVYQPEGGFLEPEKCIVAHVEGALSAGAEVHGRERVRSWNLSGEDVEVETDRARYRAKKLVLTAGSWAGKLLMDLGLPLQVERQVLGWFQPKRPEFFRLGKLPVWIVAGSPYDEDPGYGFPIYGVPGFKLGRMHHRHEVVDPDTVDRQPNAEDESLLREYVKRYFPEADGPTISLKVCLFTNTPDYNFILGLHPKHPQVVIASCCSGHGFKFCSVIGEIVADLCETASTEHPIELFSVKRFLK